jgi:hypothetical protein
VKKTQRSFAVEYKSGRRKLDPKLKSIWGNMDLKSVARDVEEEVMPLLQKPLPPDEPDMEMLAPAVDIPLPLSTPSLATRTSAAETRETSVAKEADTSKGAEAPAFEEAPDAGKKQRKPRAKKTSPVTAATMPAVETAMGGTDGWKKQGHKADVSEGPVAVRQRAPKLTPKTDQIAEEVASSAGDEMADLLQLEAENRKLRKLLGEKLRAENADLRKKLKLD